MELRDNIGKNVKVTLLDGTQFLGKATGMNDNETMYNFTRYGSDSSDAEEIGINVHSIDSVELS